MGSINYISKKIIIVFICLFTLTSINAKSPFYIKNHVLKEYRGNKKKVKIPKTVKRIGKSAFESTDEYPKDKIRTVIIPKTVKRISKEAFAFSYVKKVYIKEGVKELGSRVFMDTYLKEIHFPKSIKKAGKLLLETEEGLNNTKIYVKRGSYMAKVIRKQKPYGTYKILYE